MKIHLHRWVVWWFWLGVLGGAIALPNIIFRHLTHLQETVILLFGVVHWLFGGFVCWAWEAVKIEPEHTTEPGGQKHDKAEEGEPDVLSELIAHRNRKVFPRHSRPRKEILTDYFLHHSQHDQHHHA